MLERLRKYGKIIKDKLFIILQNIIQFINNRCDLLFMLKFLWQDINTFVNSNKFWPSVSVVIIPGILLIIWDFIKNLKKK